MRALKPLWPFMLAAIIVSCTSHQLKYPYAIKDFKPNLQPALTGIVNTGLVGYSAGYFLLRDTATDKELEQLSYAEQPILRAVALRLRTERDTVDNFNLVMGHLDDTAKVWVDWGEFGYGLEMVSDVLLEYAVWKTPQEHNITLDSVIMHHNYLHGAYFRVRGLEGDKYYPYIKQMALRETDYEGREDAAIALGGYGRKEDIPLIKEIFSSWLGRLSDGAFYFISSHPDTAYFEILDRYSRRALHRRLVEKNSDDAGEAFLAAVAAYKSPASAKLLHRMLHEKPIGFYIDSFFKDRVASTIWNARCPAYEDLIKEIKPPVPGTEVYNNLKLAPSIMDTTQYYYKIRW